LQLKAQSVNHRASRAEFKSISSFLELAEIFGLALLRLPRKPMAVKPEQHASHGHGRQRRL
jgi:hypothetical protein